MSLRIVRFHGAARRELRKAVDRYDEQAPGLGDELAIEVQRSAQRIALHPESGSPHLHGTRRAQVERFPYSLIYTERNAQLIILAVAHHRRRPDYWLRPI